MAMLSNTASMSIDGVAGCDAPGLRSKSWWYRQGVARGLCAERAGNGHSRRDVAVRWRIHKVGNPTQLGPYWMPSSVTA